MELVGPASDPDRYELTELKSSGGEGQLWRGMLDVDGAPITVAVKVIHPSKNSDLDEWRVRWQRQAELLRSLDHPGLVKVRDVFEGPVPHEAGAADTTTNTLYLVMNWVEGPTLEEWVSRNPDRDVLESARVLGKLASAVDYLHSGAVTGNPVLHRDIKPANVIVTAAGAVLVDFGFTRVIGGQPLTIAGTPAYIAPETVIAGEFSPASDRFSLGATGFFALTGETPRLNDRPYMAQKLSEVSGAEGREDIAEHVLSMMDPDPAKRPTGAVAWAQQLAAAAVSDAQMTTISQRTAPLPVTDVLPPPPADSKDGSKRRRAPLLILGAFVALLVAGAAAFFVLGGGGDDDATAESADVVSTDSATENTEAVTTTAATTTEAPTTTVALVAVPRFTSATTIEEAQADLADLGLVSEVVLEEGPGPYGVVKSTDPASGTDLAPGSTVFLTASAQPTVMPSVVGERTASGVKTLESYGVAVSQTEVLNEDAADNTIIDQTPKPGEPFAAAAQVVVSRKPAIAYLADLEPVDRSYDGFETGQAQLNGQIYTRSVMIDPYRDSPGYVEYDLARSFTRLVGIVGPRDDVPSVSVYKIEVFADGTAVFDQTLGLGQTADLDLDMSGVLRLRLQVTKVDPNPQRSSEYVVFGDTRVLGLPGSVPTTTAG